MNINLYKGQREDRLEIRQTDGTTVSSTFPKKGCFPHDLVHYIVEKHLDITEGFWGNIASGLTPEQIGEKVKLGGHASAKRSNQPDNAIIELVQAERVAECFEVELWGTATEYKTFQSILKASCDESQVPTPLLTKTQIQKIRNDLNELGTQWKEIEVGANIQLTWDVSK